MIETIEIDFDCSISNLQEEILYDGNKPLTVIVVPLWNSHGNCSQFGENKSYKGVLKIIKRTYTQLGKDWEDWQAYVGNEKVAENVAEYNIMSKIAVIKEIVGCG